MVLSGWIWITLVIPGRFFLCNHQAKMPSRSSNARIQGWFIDIFGNEELHCCCALLFNVLLLNSSNISKTLHRAPLTESTSFGLWHQVQLELSLKMRSQPSPVSRRWVCLDSCFVHVIILQPDIIQPSAGWLIKQPSIPAGNAELPVPCILSILRGRATPLSVSFGPKGAGDDGRLQLIQSPSILLWWWWVYPLKCHTNKLKQNICFMTKY